MISELVPTLVDPATAGRDFWARHHELRRVRQKESRPDDPLRPDDVEEKEIKRENPFELVHHYEISRGDTMLSMFHSSSVKPGTPEYESNKHLMWADFYVRPDQRRQGIGTRWLPIILELMDRHSSTVVGMGVDEEFGHAFLKWLGAEAKLHGAENRLKLAGVDWAMLRRWIEEGARRSPETRLELYDGPLPETMWADFSLQISLMLNTMPFEDLDHGEIVVTPDQMREWNARMAISGERMHTVIARELDGTISAMTDMTWAPYRSTIFHQQFTGVLPQARGRGLGKWIKGAMLLHVHKLYPSAEWVTTDNAGSNAPMLAINKQIGFQQFRASSEYQLSRDRLAAKIKSLTR